GTPERNPAAEDAGLKKPAMDYFKMLYADTALNGAIAPTRCGHAFFGTSSCLFATDAPFDSEQGRGLIANTIEAVEALPISPAARESWCCAPHQPDSRPRRLRRECTRARHAAGGARGEASGMRPQGMSPQLRHGAVRASL